MEPGRKDDVVIADELTDLIKVDAPTGVGFEDMLSTGLEFMTAADPIIGPMAVEPEVGLVKAAKPELEPTLRRAAKDPPKEPEEDPESADKKACVDAGTAIAVGYGLGEVADAREERGVEDPGAADPVCVVP